MKVLITGGAGYIGSAVAWACLDAGIAPVVLDSLAAGSRELVPPAAAFYQGDIADERLADHIFACHAIDAVIHCAALTGIPESLTDPARYWRVNVAGTLAVAGHLMRHECPRLVFSSSAAVYADSGAVSEACPVGPASPYGRTKAACEAMLTDIAAGGGPRVLALRYFNPIGADPQMRTGQLGNPAGVLGAMLRAHRTGTPFPLTGTDWPTRDGSGVRDYVHVSDLAAAHVAALTWFDALPVPAAALNIGTGTGHTVCELLAAFERVTGQRLRVLPMAARQGDTAGGYAITVMAEQLLGWKPRYTLEESIRHALQWARAEAIA